MAEQQAMWKLESYLSVTRNKGGKKRKKISAAIVLQEKLAWISM
jgi:hypothetical protein